MVEHATPDMDFELFWDREGVPVSLRRFVQLRADLGYRRVRHDRVGHLEVITVWLGTDQGDGMDEEPPLVFGTIVRNTEAGTYDDASELFAASEGDAVANHDRRLRELPLAERVGAGQ